MSDHTPQESNVETHADQKLQNCLADLEQWKDKCMRVAADFQNYKRRMEKEQTTWISSTQADVITNLLPIIDDMDRAMAESQKEGKTDMQAWLAGFEMIRTALHKLLTKYGVTEISQNRTFDPLLHEALASVEVPGKQAGEIIEVLQKGYMVKDQVLRPAKVAVAK